jgi:predicted Rossmann fold nucleotide-binding protein DprA/Smf involved in DNA uptake
MDKSAAIDGARRVALGGGQYPARLSIRLGQGAPESLHVLGPAEALSLRMTAFLCSRETPGSTILRAFDQAAAWREAGTCIVSGFHSPMEQECLEILLRGKQPVIWMLARALTRPRLPRSQRKAFDDGRLTIVSPFKGTETRTTADLARKRNDFAAAMAEEVYFAHIREGGSLETLAADVARWGVPAFIIDRMDGRR